MKWYSIILMVIWLIILANSSALGRLDGYIRPVITDFNITEVSGTAISGSFKKVRQCELVEVNWWYTNENGRSPTTVDTGYARVFTPGLNEYRNWITNIEPAYILTNSYAEMVHDCGLPFHTIDTIYPTISSEE